MMKKLVVKKKVEKVDPQAVKASKFGLNYSEIIDSFFRLNPNVRKFDISQKLFISKMGFNHRLKQSYYGNIFDLIELSLATGHNFLEPAVNVLKNNGVAVQKIYTEQEVGELAKENADLKRQLHRAARDNDLLHEMIKELKGKGKNA